MPATLLTWSCYPNVDFFVTRVTFVADTKFVPRTKTKCFWKSSETFFASAWRATMLPRFAMDGQHRKTQWFRHNVSSFCRVLTVCKASKGINGCLGLSTIMSPHFVQQSFPQNVCFLCRKAQEACSKRLRIRVSTSIIHIAHMSMSVSDSTALSEHRKTTLFLFFRCARSLLSLSVKFSNLLPSSLSPTSIAM